MDTEQYAATAEFYDYVVPYQTRQDVGFFVEAAQASGGPVLEVGCGSGRVLIPTARDGISIYGIDLSPHMLAVCEQRLEQEPAEVQQRVQLDLADMRDFNLGQTFQLITIPFRPFQHLIEVEDQIACLRCIRRHLADDGRFILDLFNPSLPVMAREVTGEEQGDEPEFTMPDGRRVLRRNRIVARDVFKQYHDVELIYHITHPDGRTERLVHGFPMRYLFRYEAEHLLARCGFAVEALYADYDRSPYGSKYPGELIFVSQERVDMLIAITRQISPRFDQCELTHLDRQPIDLDLARAQHRQYEAALRDLGCEVVSLPPEPDLPDSVFVEDVALVFDEIAVITRPGADSRKPETASIARALSSYRALFAIEAPGTLDGGDVLHVGKMVYVGLSSRSNRAGVEQLQGLLAPYGYTVKGVEVSGCLHLKSAVTQVSEDTLLTNPAWVDRSTFGEMRFIEVVEREPSAANAVWIENAVIYPPGFPGTQQRLEEAGLHLKIVAATEVAKAEGAVTCCSLIFQAK